MGYFLWGSFAFGLVIGWVTYRTLRRTEKSAISDIAAVIGAVGGAGILVIFPAETDAFGLYAIGLAVGFFGYLLLSLLLQGKLDEWGFVAEFLGERRRDPGARPQKPPEKGARPS